MKKVAGCFKSGRTLCNKNQSEPNDTQFYQDFMQLSPPFISVFGVKAKELGNLSEEKKKPFDKNVKRNQNKEATLTEDKRQISLSLQTIFPLLMFCQLSHQQ